MKLKRKTKDLLLGITSVILVIGLCLGVVGLFNNIKSKNEGIKEINVNYEIGSLNNLGKYVQSDAYLYSDDFIDCYGLEVKLDFEAQVKYQVFYYNESQEFISSTTVLEDSEDFIVPEDAKYCKLLLTPIWDEDVEEDKQVLKWTNTRQFTKHIHVYVATNRLNELEVAQDLYKVDVFQTIVNDAEVFTVTDITLATSNYYRIFMQESDNGYVVTGVSKIGSENKDVDYDLILMASKSIDDTNILEVIKMICDSKDFDDFVVTTRNIAGGNAYYFTTNPDILDGYFAE